MASRKIFTRSGAVAGGRTNGWPVPRAPRNRAIKRLNEEKTQVLDARQKSFEFLGFSFRRQRSSKSGKMIALVEPSRTSEQRFRDEVRSLTARWTHCVPQQDVVQRVNRYVRGWVNYFHLHNSTRVFARQRFFLEQRMRKYPQKRRQLRGNGMVQWPASRLYKELGLCVIPVHARYRQRSHALR